MTATAHEILDVDLANWVTGARFFGTDADVYFIIDADLADYPEDGGIKVVRRPTAVLYCTADAAVTDLIPDHIYPPGTTPEQVIAALGYILEGAP